MLFEEAVCNSPNVSTHHTRTHGPIHRHSNTHTHTAGAAGASGKAAAEDGHVPSSTHTPTKHIHTDTHNPAHTHNHTHSKASRRMRS